MIRVGKLGWLWVLVVMPVVHAEEHPAALSPALQQLASHADDKDVYERQKAFLRIEATRDPGFVPLLQQHVQSRDPHTRAFSVRALAAIAGSAAIPTLLDSATHDRKSDVRVAALLGLEPLRDRDPSIEPVFLKALRDRSADVRMVAVDIVSRSPAPEAKEAIRKRWKREHHGDVRRVLKDAMKRIGESG